MLDNKNNIGLLYKCLRRKRKKVLKKSQRQNEQKNVEEPLKGKQKEYVHGN